MAIIHLKFQQLLRILRVFGIFTNSWPMSPSAGKKELFLRELYYNIAVFVMWAVLIPMMIDIYKRERDIGVMMKNLCHIATLMEAAFNSILCQINRKQLQSLFVNIEEFMKISKDRERVVLQKYVDRYMTFISFVALTFLLAGMIVIISPFFLSLELPMNAWYSFSIKPPLRKFITYNMQSFSIIYTLCNLDVDIMIAVLFLYTSARVELLADEIQQVSNEAEVISCIRKHQDITKFISETQEAIQYLLFKTTLTMGFTVISGCFPLLYLESYYLAVLVLSIVWAALQRMYVTAWPADDLREISTSLSWSIYSAPWFNKSPRIKSDIFIMLQKSQKPIVISMGGLLPALTKEYYGTFVTSVMSYFMTMRTAINA